MRRRRQRQQALADTAGATGFTRPTAQGITVSPQTPRRQPAYSLSDFARYAQLRGQFEGRVQPGRRYGQQYGRRYGQQQGFGRGYMLPRRAIGGWQQPYGVQRENPNYMGYAPQTAGMYGGRPIFQQRPAGAQSMYPTNQAAAMTRPQYSAWAYNIQPWGGYGAVPRSYYPQY